MARKTARAADRMDFFVFDSDVISREVTGIYGAFAQFALLQAIARALVPGGGWDSLGKDIRGCHGDLIEWSSFGDTPAAVVLRSWVEGQAYGIDLADLHEDLRFDWEAAGTIKQLEAELAVDLGGPLPPIYVPYLIGLAGLSKPVTKAAHLDLTRGKVAGYLGRFVVREPGDFRHIAAALSLIDSLRIWGATCSGWHVSAPKLAQVGLGES